MVGCSYSFRLPVIDLAGGMFFLNPSPSADGEKPIEDALSEFVVLTSFVNNEARTLRLSVVVVTSQTYVITGECAVTRVQLSQDSTHVSFTEERKLPHGPVVVH